MFREMGNRFGANLLWSYYFRFHVNKRNLQERVDNTLTLNTGDVPFSARVITTNATYDLEQPESAAESTHKLDTVYSNIEENKMDLYSNIHIKKQIRSERSKNDGYTDECLTNVRNKAKELDICVQRARMPPPGALIKVPASSDNYRSIKADLYNIEETNEGPFRSKRLAFRWQSNLGYEYEINMFSSLPIHSISFKYDLDL